ncbi:ATP-binding protein [Streptomyces sp. SID12501]|uniref:Tetratricopeptide repeat protein n=1 Tax=Streptomyces sp. SID12501 TaxID=2706042 RepID=A0A6B3BYD4_9ACTN|nr:ATP-binding protein [Streptomyces sp. SID12501]NEC89358.1 tetratricopeptide repeat protein [Streptomyces sp. SID12501]
MSGSERRGPSRGELNRRRLQAQFVGRRAQLSLFTENLGKDPQSETDPAEYLFHVRGVGGIGKSTLLRQWQETARSAGAVTAVVDENDAHGVQQTLTELARQLAEQTGPLKEFDRAAEQYRREQEETTADPVPADGEASLSSRVVTQAVLGATATLVPGAGAVAAMANPDAAAQGLDRLRAGTRSRRGRGGDVTEVNRAFVSELRRLCDRHRWVVLFFDTWEETDRYLDGWLRDLLNEVFGPLPVNLMVVLAGRDPLAEREWALLRPLVVDVPLEVFTEAETRALLASRGVTEPDVVEAVLQLSMGLPLLVGLLALARPVAAEDVDADGDVVDTAVKRFVQWIKDEQQQETVLACALAPQLNEDIFAAAAPPEAEGLWGWLCEQPFVSGRGDFKSYHAVVRASMVRRQRLHSPQGWTTAHDGLAEAHATWRTEAEQGIPEEKRWDDPRWRRHRLAETYHRLCARPAAQLTAALEQAVHAAAQDTSILRQWTDSLGQAARDTADPALRTWADRLQQAVTGDQPALAALTALLAHGRLNKTARAWAQTYLGRELYLADRDEESITELSRAIAMDPRNTRALAYRGDTHRWLGHLDQALADFTAALVLDPADVRALGGRGRTHTLAGRFDEAVTDLTAAIDLDPSLDWTLAHRGEAHRLAGRYDEAVTDFTAAITLNPAYSWALGSRGQAHRSSGRYDEAITDLTAAITLNPAYSWALAQRGGAHQQAGRYDEGVTDLTAAITLNSTDPWTLAQRGEAHRLAGRYDEAVTDFTAAITLDPAYSWALGSRGQAHRSSGRYDEAITDLTAAITLDPSLDWALAHRGEAHRLAGRYDEAITDLTAAITLNPADPWTLAQRGEAHRQTDRHDEAVADFTAALDLSPTYTWALSQRGVSHREAGRHSQAREDLEQAVASEPDELSFLFEKLMLDTLATGLASGAEQWAELFAVLAERAQGTEAEIRLAEVFRMLLLEPEGDLSAATDAFLAVGPDPDTVTDLLHYLEELCTTNGALADRALRCRQLVRGHREISDPAPGGV